MTHTVERLMSLAYDYADKYADSYEVEQDNHGLRTSREALRKALTEALDTLDFYKRRVELLQKWQSKMRDPERTMACDIIANGQMMPEGERYEIQAAQPVREHLTDDQIVSACYSFRHDFGLLPQETRDSLIRTATDWAQAFGIGGDK